MPLGDRFERVTLLAVLFLAVALVSGGLILGDGYPSLLACALCLGLAAGATSPAFLALIADRFGAASFGTANGAATFIIAVSGAACLRFAGEAYDYTGTYDLMFVTFMGLGIVSAMVMYATRVIKSVVLRPKVRPRLV